MVAPLHLVSELGQTGEKAALASPIRVVLADDHDLVRRNLRRLLESEEGVEVIAEAGDLAAAVRHVQRNQPHVLVLDLSMPSGSGMETIRQLRRRAPDTRVVVLTIDDSPIFAQRALASGAIGLVLKDRADGELPLAVRAAARGEEHISPVLAARLDALQRSLGDDALTLREIEVLRLLALGFTSAEIAGKLSISARTVDSHRARMHDKLGLTSRAELVRYALGRGLLRA